MHITVKRTKAATALPAWDCIRAGRARRTLRARACRPVPGRLSHPAAHGERNVQPTPPAGGGPRLEVRRPRVRYQEGGLVVESSSRALRTVDQPKLSAPPQDDPGLVRPVETSVLKRRSSRKTSSSTPAVKPRECRRRAVWLGHAGVQPTAKIAFDFGTSESCRADRWLPMTSTRAGARDHRASARRWLSCADGPHAGHGNRDPQVGLGPLRGRTPYRYAHPQVLEVTAGGAANVAVTSRTDRGRR